MQKDLKTGVFLGLTLIAVVALWLATRPTLSTKARMLQADDSTQPAQIQNPPATYKPQAQRRLLYEDHRPTEPAAGTQPEKNITPYPSRPKQTHTLKSNVEGVVRIHIVEEGQTLSGIAYKYYGSANKWRKIFNDNRSRLKDANTLIPGMRLIIPE
jgi:nucleoid-associated protein YgaU